MQNSNWKGDNVILNNLVRLEGETSVKFIAVSCSLDFRYTSNQIAPWAVHLNIIH